MSVIDAPAPAAGLAAAGVEPVYTTHAMLNVGDELHVTALGLTVLSIPASRLALGIDSQQVVSALTEGAQYDVTAPTVVGTRRFTGDEGPLAGLAWAVTAAGVRALNRRDLDPRPGGILDYADEAWTQLPRIEQQVAAASRAYLFATEQSPPVLQTAGTIVAGGLSSVTFAASDMGAAAVVITPLAVFSITAASIAGKAFGEYLADLIERLPGSRSRR